MKNVPMIKCAHCKKEIPVGAAKFLPEISAYYRAVSLAILRQTKEPLQPDDESIMEKYGVDNPDALFCANCLRMLTRKAC